MDSQVNETAPRHARPSRRALLHLALGAMGAAAAGRAAGGLGRTVEGASNPLEIDANNTGTKTTSLTANVKGSALSVANPSAPALLNPGGIAFKAHAGPAGESLAAPGSVAVYAYNNAMPFRSTESFGVFGVGRSVGVNGLSPHYIGVRGAAGTGIGDESKTVGVMGVAEGGTGLYGNGRWGVRAFGPTAASFASSDIGLEVLGRLKFTQALWVEVPAGATSIDVEGRNTVGPNAFIIATAQGNGAVAVTGAHRIDNSTLRVHLSGPAPAGGLRVGYLVLG